MWSWDLKEKWRSRKGTFVFNNILFIGRIISIKLSEICNKFRRMACVTPQYVTHISSLLLLPRKKELGGGGGRRQGGWGSQTRLSLLSLRPLKHLQIPPLVHQLVQDGVPLEAGSCLHLVLHATLLSLSPVHLHFTLVLTKDGLSRIGLKHGQLGGLVL